MPCAKRGGIYIGVGRVKVDRLAGGEVLQGLGEERAGRYARGSGRGGKSGHISWENGVQSIAEGKGMGKPLSLTDIWRGRECWGRKGTGATGGGRKGN